MTRTHKYNAKRTLYNGVWFASKLEAKLAADFDLELKAKTTGLILVEWQSSFPLKGLNGAVICNHIVDFVLTYADRVEAHEAKGYPTPEWKLKKKLFEDNYPSIKYVVHSRGKR